jgi:hypothetical protein
MSFACGREALFKLRNSKFQWLYDMQTSLVCYWLQLPVVGRLILDWFLHPLLYLNIWMTNYLRERIIAENSRTKSVINVDSSSTITA